MRSKGLAYISISVVFLLGIQLGFSQKFTAFVNKNPVSVNEVFQLSFKIEGGNGRVVYPDFTGLQILSGPNTSQSMQFINGQMSQSVIYYFQARATKEGPINIGTASVKVNGKSLKSKPIKLEVKKGATNSNSAAPQASNANRNPRNNRKQASASDPDLMKRIAQNVFVRAYISKKEVYLGEQLTLTYKLFSKANLSGVKEAAAPKFAGFWVENIDVSDAQWKVEALDGVQYRTALIRKAILIPNRAGKITIDPYQLETNVRVTVQPQKRGGGLFDSFFSRYEDVPFKASSPAITVNVKRLPAGQPTSFNGAVGSFTLDVNIDKAKTETGEPVTLRIKIAGEGNLKNIQQPELKFPQDFDLYDPKVDSRISIKSGRQRGSKSFDFLLIPLNPGEFKLPNVNFSFFDPKEQKYVELAGPELALSVTGEAQMPIANMPPVSQEDIELLNQDINFIKTGDAELRGKDQTFWASAGFWGLSVTPFLLFGLLFMYQRKQVAEAGDVVGTRMKYATKVAKKKLAAAEKLINSNDRSFYSEVDRALWGYLGDKLALKPSQLNREHTGQLLLEQGVGQETVDQMTQILDECEMALFAPVSSTSEKNNLYQQAVNLIGQIEKQIS